MVKPSDKLSLNRIINTNQVMVFLRQYFDETI